MGESIKATLPRLVATKFQPPTYANDLVTRPHLIERLDAGCSRKLIVIQAPAGFGKTTLAVQWRETLRTVGRSVVWLSLDEDDNDLIRFLSYLVKGLGEALPSVKRDLLSALEIHSEDAVKFVLGDLINEIASQEQDVFLMFDDWHVVQDSRIHKAMQFLLAHASSNLHVLIASREEPACNLTRLRVQDQVVDISAAELRFDIDECRAFLEDINDLGLPGDSVDRIWEATDGWIAALQLASLSLKTSHDPGEAIQGLSAQPRLIGDYLAENVLNNLPVETLDFLLRTSVLERLSGPLCAAVTGVSDSQRILEELERQDLFIRPLDEERRWFRYHDLFAAYLRRRLQRDYPDEVEALHRRACDWLAAEGYTGEAVTHALAANAVARGLDLVERDAMWLVEHSRMATLLGLVNRLPYREVERRPWLQMAVAWAHCLTHHPEAAQQTLDAMESALVGCEECTEQEKEALRAEARVVQGAINIYGDRLADTPALVRPCIDSAEAYRPWVVAVASNVLTYVYIHSFEFDEARRLQSWARAHHHRTQGPFSDVYGRCFSGMAAAYEGQLRQAAECFKQALNLAYEAAGAHSHAARLAAALWGQLNYEYHDLDHADRLLEESRSLGAEGGVADFSLATYVPLARLRALRGDMAGAHTMLDEGMETARALGLERLAAAVDGERVRLYLADGEIRLAERLLVSDLSEPENASGIDVLAAESRQLAAARVFHAQGHLAQAANILEILIERAQRQRRRFSEVGLQVLLALVNDERGDQEAADAGMVAALQIGAAQGMVRTFLDEGRRIVPLLERVRERIRRDSLEWAVDEAVAHQVNRLIVLAREESGCRSVSSVRECNGRDRAEADATMTTALYVEPLKNREHQILALLGNGCSNKEIARTLGVGVNTVKWYLKSIYAKLCVNRRTQAIVEARRLGIIE